MQAIEPLVGGGALKLTVARFLLAGHVPVDGRGIVPDVSVPNGARRTVGVSAQGRPGADARLTEPLPARIVGEVSTRGRVAVAEPFFEPGPRRHPGSSRGRRRRAPGISSRWCRTAAGAGGSIGSSGGRTTRLPSCMRWRWRRAPPIRGRRTPPSRAIRRRPATASTCATSRPSRSIREGAKDHDDALSVDGDRVYVHIADVSAHVPAGSALDAEAARRATSVYLPGPGRPDASRRAVVRPLQPPGRRGPAGRQPCARPGAGGLGAPHADPKRPHAHLPRGPGGPGRGRRPRCRSTTALRRAADLANGLREPADGARGARDRDARGRDRARARARSTPASGRTRRRTG